MSTSLPPKGDADKKVGAYDAPLTVSAQDLPNLSVKVRAGSFFNSQNHFIEFAGGTTSLLTPPTSMAKWVIITLTDAGTLALVNGDIAIAPAFPAIPSGNMPLAAVHLMPLATYITNPMIVDIRPFLRSSDIVPNMTSTLASFASIQDMSNGLSTKADIDGIPGNSFTLNKNALSLPTSTAAVIVNRGSALANVSIQWNESLTQWEATNDGVTYFPITAGAWATLVHSHVAADISDFAAATHAIIATSTIIESQVTNLTVDLATKAIATSLTNYVLKAGDTLTGPLVLNADPITDLEAATKIYVDVNISTALPLTGGTLTGNLTVKGAGLQPITLASIDTGSSGLTIERAGFPSSPARLMWEESIKSWLIGPGILGTYDTILTDVIANMTGPVTSIGNVTSIANGALSTTMIGGTSTYVPYFDSTGFMGTDSTFSFNDTTKALSATTFIGALAGNASTVTTNADLTGPVTSVGNVTSIANGALSTTMIAGTNTLIPYFDVTGFMGTDATLSFNDATKALSAATFIGPLTGNASTVTTNANMTGPVTSVGNTTAIANGALSITMIAGTNTLIPYFDVTGFMGTDSAFSFNNVTKALSATTFIGTLTGNASTVTTNANMTGPVTSIGNVTSIANGALTTTMIAGTNTLIPYFDVTGFMGTDATFSFNNTTKELSATTFIGTLTGNASSASTALVVTTNANLTGPVTSVGNTTSIANGALSTTMIAGTNTLIPYFDVTGFMGTDSAFSFNNVTKALSASTFIGSLTGNASSASTALTVTTNADLLGVVTSIGNVTTIANGALTTNMIAGTNTLIPYFDVAGLMGEDATFSFNDTTKTLSATAMSATTMSAITFNGTLTGNASTVTTNANLTGIVTSVGNATSIANGALSISMIGGTNTLIPYFDANGFMGTDASFSFDDTTKTLSATTFIGALTGNASTATLSMTVTTNANLTGMVTSVGNATTVITNADLIGDVTSVGNTTTLTNAPVIAKVLTGFTSGPGAITAADSILTAFQKTDGNNALKAPLDSPIFTGLPTLPSYIKGALPTATSAGQVIYVSDSTRPGGIGSMCFSNAVGTTGWIDTNTGVAVV